MLKKTAIALIAAATISAAAFAPTDASAKVKPGHVFAGLGLFAAGLAIGTHTPHYSGHHGYRGYHGYGYRRCFRRMRRVMTPYGPRWRRIRICRRYY